MKYNYVGLVRNCDGWEN